MKNNLLVSLTKQNHPHARKMMGTPNQTEKKSYMINGRQINGGVIR
ncbi:hypothetical protein B4135_2271 [Caldibacillus debilis]|uniref:Uncharacterized protein n=1 Tax=Caldibacillus debilis TaxID=301148 RepID=A0A150M2C7_9BACI|nr:hypothetical protein B4135_2271 [Caldibacillus debilis]